MEVEEERGRIGVMKSNSDLLIIKQSLSSLCSASLFEIIYLVENFKFYYVNSIISHMDCIISQAHRY
jgi:hypothetical protein